MKQKYILSLCLVISLNSSGNTSGIVKITAVGDIMLGTIYPDSTTLPNHDSFKLFEPLHSYLKSADVTFGNLESTITDNLSQVKTCRSDTRCYYFAMPSAYTNSLKIAGFDVLSIANNHINDFGAIGRKSTMQNLKKNKINFAGLTSCPIDTFMRKGIKYGFCAFAPNAGTLSIKNIKKAEAVVKILNEISDIVIVSFHAGGEGTGFQHITKNTEVYIGENRGNVYEFTHKMIDAGADVLLGHGPHVSRAVEIYKNRFITYSMGNFCTYSRVSVQGQNGIAPLYQIYTNRKGEFLKARIIPTFQRKGKSPKVDPKKRAISIIKQLTYTDFPEMIRKIHISNDGWIKKIKQRTIIKR